MLEKLIKKCGDCNLKECIGCEITYSDVKELEKEFDSAGRQGYIKGSNATHRILVEIIKERLEQNKAKTDCTYCNNTCDSYAVCMFCKELLEEK